MKTKKDLIIPCSWEERKPAFLERFLYIPKHYGHEEVPKLEWSNLFAEHEKPIHIEFCCGNGEWVGAQAKSSLDVNWVAVDLDFARARKVWLKIDREQISNLYVVCAEACAFIRHYVPKNTVAHAFINFPDPWPKLRHAKHRLIQPLFVSALKEILQEKGSVTLVTDDPVYAEQMKKVFGQDNLWKFVPFSPESYGNSFFADLWKKKGRTIQYLRYIYAP